MVIYKSASSKGGGGTGESEPRGGGGGGGGECSPSANPAYDVSFQIVEALS